MKYIRILAVLLAMCLLFAGCKGSSDHKTPDELFDEEQPDADFSRCGIVFDLPEDFTDYSNSPLATNYEFLYASPYVGIYGLKDHAGGLDEEINSFEIFVSKIAERYGTEATQKDGIWVMSYEDPEQNEPQMIVCAFYEVGDMYWSICSYCPSDLFEENGDAMWGYVTSVTFE